MKKFMLQGTSVLFTVIVSAGLTLCGISEAWAQQKQKISYKLPAELSKFTQQHVLDVGDVPGHQVRIYEVHRTYPKDLLVVEGVRVVEEWLRGYSDYIDINGPFWGYGIYSLENGDKIFTRSHGTSQSIVNPDGSKKNTFTGVITLVGGTGKLRGILGTLRQTTIFDPTAGVIEGQWEGEYWIEK